MYYFIVNPVSRSGHGLEVWKQTENTLKKRKIAYKALFTKCSGHATELTQKITKEFSSGTIVAIGGDGTINEVLNGLPKTHDFALSFIPVGSGNDFARGMTLPNDPQESLERILSKDAPMFMDTGCIQTPKRKGRFAISASIGYDAEVCYDATHSNMKKFLNKLHLGKLVYAYSAVKLLFSFRPSPMDVELDGKKLHYDKAYLIAAMNLQYEGGGFHFCPGASCHDDILDFLVVHSLPKLAVLFLFPTAYFAKHTLFPGIEIVKGKEMKVKSGIAYKLHQDGEYAGLSDTVTFRADADALSFL